MKVINHIKAYEVDGREARRAGVSSGIVIQSHDTNDQLVEILIAPDLRVAVLASQLRAAIDNAVNWPRS